MMEQFFVAALTLERLHTGPLAPYIDRFASLLSGGGYRRYSVREKLRLVGSLSCWLLREGLRVDDLDEQVVIRFLRHRGGKDSVRRGDHATLRLLLEQLRDSGVIARLSPEIDDGMLHCIECEFARYLLQERGLSQATVTNYVPAVRAFLSERFGTSPIQFDKLYPLDITVYIVRHAKTLCPSRAKLMVTALRSFLRFLRLRGDIVTDLALAVPTVAHWRLSTVPKFLRPEEVKCLLDSCDRSTHVGQRDYSILLLLSRLGLRAGEVVALALDDIDWESGQLTVRGKGAHRDQLPIPQDVGKALAMYLRHWRPGCLSRQVF
jgi:hypothetical protein